MTALDGSGNVTREYPTPSQDAVQVITGRLVAQLETISRRLVARYQEEIADYRLADETLLEDVRRVSLGGLAGRPPGPLSAI